MKGIVFTELIELVEEKWGMAMADRLLEPEGLKSGGVFTAVGTYDDQDMFTILGRLSEATGLSTGDLQRAFGGHLFGSFVRGYADMLARFDCTFDLLSSLDDFIHPAVQRLYPDATLPSFQVQGRSDKHLEMLYTSQRRMPEFAVGLIHAAATYFGETVAVEYAMEEGADDQFSFLVKL